MNKQPETAEEFVSATSDYFADGSKKSDGIGVSGIPETIDEYLKRTAAETANANVDMKARSTWQGKKSRIALAKAAEIPQEVEVKVRMELSDMNRSERRAWLKKQSREAGKVRRRMLTVSGEKSA